MKRTLFMLLLCAAVLLAACGEGLAPRADRAAAPTSGAPTESEAPQVPSAGEPEPAAPAEDPEPVTPPVEEPEPVTPPVEELEPATPPVEESEPMEPSVEDPPLTGEEIATPYMETYGDYLAWLDSTDLPAAFVPYEAISALGEFQHFVCLSGYGDYSHYMYSLVDETGAEFVLYVEYNRNGPELTPLPIIDDINPDNMRCTQSSQRGRYLYEGLEYKYVSGRLLNITWENEGHIFVLSGDSLGSYPDGADTFLAKLFDLSQASQALNSIDLAPEERM